MRNARGLTLVETAVVVSLLAVAACLVAPSLAQVRGPEAMKPRSTANLRLHGQVLGLYANTHRGEVLNPYQPLGASQQVWGIRPEWAGGGTYPMKADGYSYHWADLIRHYYADYERPDVFAAPGDLETLRSIEDSAHIPNWVVDVSYWYSPTLFFSEERFAEETGGDTASGAIPQKVYRHEVADLTFPSRKVVVFEKQDFTTPDKLLFAHPDARVGLLLGDASVRESDNPPLYAAIAADPSLAPSGGNWADEWGLGNYNMDNDSSPDELLEDQQHLYPAFYMWTREGIAGRDLF